MQVILIRLMSKIKYRSKRNKFHGVGGNKAGLLGKLSSKILTAHKIFYGSKWFANETCLGTFLWYMGPPLM